MKQQPLPAWASNCNIRVLMLREDLPNEMKQSIEKDDIADLQECFSAQQPIMLIDALRLAAWKGKPKAVRYLLSILDPSSDYSDALGWAAQRGHIDCVRILLPHSDPKAHNSAALLWAIQERRWDCIDLLWDISDTEIVRGSIKSLNNEHSVWQEIARHQAQRQHALLDNAVVDDKNKCPQALLRKI